ncbi:hypothetical protein N5O88_09810 [Pseudomonas sp. GD03721]|nr:MULTISPECIES: hypothetical protein [unclassified Pseudomonas]MDH1440441.1 hypothetical protein [Pseudomonas sp. GD03722]WGG03471.1 hypothetical protein N5O88_09810 [Pseudomonas sp. GD03721]WGG07639.1 hypothetical protein N5O87_09820 [Pseudomonas sp. GD03919]
MGEAERWHRRAGPDEADAGRGAKDQGIQQLLECAVIAAVQVVDEDRGRPGQPGDDLDQGVDEGFHGLFDGEQRLMAMRVPVLGADGRLELLHQAAGTDCPVIEAEP